MDFTFSFRQFAVYTVTYAAVCTVIPFSAECLAQTAPISPQLATPPVQMTPLQYSPLQSEPAKPEPIRSQPIKAEPLSVTHNGNLVYARDPNAGNVPPRPAAPPMGNPAVPYPNSAPYLTNPAHLVNPAYPTTPVYPNYPNYPNNQNGHPHPPVRVATGNLPYTPTPPLVPPAVVPSAAIPPAVPTPTAEMPTYVGRSAPANKVIPFFLNPQEQAELDQFLVRWEKYSSGIKRYEVDFNLFIYDAAIPGADPSKPHKIAFGYFKYVANPLRFVYHVEGEWQNNKQVKRDGDKNPNIFAEKSIIDPQTVWRYDYNAKTVIKIHVPPELIGKGIADSPLPLIFGAKAEELKRRFSMKLMPTSPTDQRVWLHARPLLIEDQQEFKQLEILLDNNTLQAVGLKEYDINDKAYKVFELKNPSINNQLDKVLTVLATVFKTDVPVGWRLDEHRWQSPVPAPAANMPPVANPMANPNGNSPNRQEIPLYRGN